MKHLDDHNYVLQLQNLLEENIVYVYEGFNSKYFIKHQFVLYFLLLTYYTLLHLVQLHIHFTYISII